VPRVHILVLNWNQWGLTAACLRSLLNVDYPACRIVVIDNGSTDDSMRKLAEEFEERVDLIAAGGNLGFAAGNNLGIRRALEQAGDYVMLLNNDTIVDHDFLAPLVRALECHPDCAAVVPKIYFLSRPDTIWAAGGRVRPWLGQAANRGYGQRERGQFAEAGPVDFGSGCCLLISRAGLDQVGMLNEAYFAYFEDADWCLRARAKGMQVWYVPESRIWHVAGAATRRAGSQGNGGRTSPQVYYLTARNNLWLIRNHFGRASRPVALASFALRHLLLYSLVFLCLRRWAKLAHLWRGARDGLCGPVAYTTAAWDG
jgi:GT2 family glycosyltransferase